MSHLASRLPYFPIGINPLERFVPDSTETGPSPFSWRMNWADLTNYVLVATG